MTDEQKSDYKEQIRALLNNYKDGWDVFKNANKAKTWEYPLELTDEAKAAGVTPPDPTYGWLELVEQVIGIVAKEKYGLDCYDNTIEVISSDQMLDAYASVGMPVSYEHWSFGKQRVAEEKLYKQGKKGLAYEIVINTDPAIAYCMEGNSPLMQMLVIAHASFGHNSFFKGNHMFKQFTDATNIISDLVFLRDYIRECEDDYGEEEVEKLLDACHALQTHSVHRYTKAEPKTQKELEEIRKTRREERFNTPIESDIYKNLGSKKEFDDAAKGKHNVSAGNEENLLLYIAENAPHLEPWKRKIMRMLAGKAQYFYPQRQTQVMNEGWASFWHYTLLHDMRDLDLIDDGMMQEFLESHSGVLFQPDYDSPYYSGGMNPYALGFAIFQDIKRICLEPTKEDREWAPDIAGNPDWVSVLKDVMEDFKDESYILQHLSPKVIRDFNLFGITDDAANEQFIKISAIHDTEGYQDIRNMLASNYRLADNEPRIEAYEYHERTDRRLILRHTMIDGKPVDENDMEEVLKHIYQLWEHPVILESVDKEGEHYDELSVPPYYEPPEPA